MYIRNRSMYDKYNKYNIGELPANYSGQYQKESVHRDVANVAETNHGNSEPEKKESVESKSPETVPVQGEHKNNDSHSSHPHESHKHEEAKKERKENHKSLIGSLFGGGKDGHRGILSKFFGEKDGKGIIAGLELEDLVLLAVIFFLLKDGIEDDFLIILALILLA